MKQEISTTKPPAVSGFRLAYFIFLLLVIYQLSTGNYEDAIPNLGIAMIFDPFDHTVKWNDRPLYQRVWLCTHLALTICGFAFLIFR